MNELEQLKAENAKLKAALRKEKEMGTKLYATYKSLQCRFKVAGQTVSRLSKENTQMQKTIDYLLDYQAIYLERLDEYEGRIRYE